jgi:glycosyltransferase involved in cell wall biosynthesis
MSPKSRTQSVDWPRISIVMPSYNQGDYIEATIRSVVMQHYPNCEFIVMDGGSTDHTVAILERYRSHFAFYHSAPDNGQADAIRTGFERATGDILAWINSDDYYLPGTFFRVARYFMAHPSVQFVNSDVLFLNQSTGTVSRQLVAGPNRLFARTLASQGAPQMGCFWRASAYRQAGGVNASFQFSMDLDLFIRLMAVGRARRLPGPPTAVSRMHDNAKTATLQHIASAEDKAIIRSYASPLEYKLLKGPIKALRWIWYRPARVRYTLNTIGIQQTK